MEEEYQANYYIGFCKNCNQCKAIKNGLCYECETIINNKSNFPDIFKDIFGGFNDRR